MKIASVQLEIKDTETKQQRMDRVLSMIDELRDYDLITLPEVWATGYFTFDKYKEEAEELGGSFIQTFSEKAKELNVLLFAGSFIEKKEDRYYNTSILFGNDGSILATYRKVHLFRYGSKEGEILTRGEEPVVVETEFGKVGLTTCYDLRFPELYRKQVEMGAEILLVTSAWPHQRLAHWNLFNQVRALENQCFLISCNCVGKTKGVELAGNSKVVDPWGVVLASASTKEAILTAEIDTSVITQVRDDFPQLKHRVFCES
ncbi:carbon-nitrogen family hydrolase [Alkalihalobacterium alkalinitrilicum]|uniref:carbon-nitrogen family hydrolase n=1 Tax=Alkalihalobacterium alkalinitrilicum TaxID=427920 RepID=UPI000995A663|nr:carbon-nitrogen family hydrolase [Alkalihalobacterium alkalinitrilicum]